MLKGNRTAFDIDPKPPIVNNPLSELIIHSQQKKIKTYKKDEFLYHENEAAEGLHFIITGKVKLTKTDNQQNQTILYIAQRGDTLAIHSVINEHFHSNSAIAMASTYTCFIPANEFMKLVESDNKYKMMIMQALCVRIDLYQNQMNSRVIKSIPERLLDSLLFLSQTYGIDENHVLKIALSIEDLANMVGTSKTYLNKVIIDLHKKGLMTFKNNRIEIPDINNLHLYTHK
jgi:CRP/FNR family transcriptional regulator, polysaccharide utilization system transcription regulator